MLRPNARLKTVLLITAGLVFTLSVLSFTVDPFESSESAWYEKAFFSALSPFQRVSMLTGRKIKHFVNQYVFFIDTAEENRILRERQRELDAQLLLFRHVLEENQRLKSLLQLKASRPWTSITAKIIAHSPQAEFRLLTIDQGAKHGIRIRMPVVSAQGLVGQVSRVGETSAQVLLLTDPSSAVDARQAETGARGLIRGRLFETYWDRRYYLTVLEYVDRTSQIPVGGTIVTSGLDGIFPEGIPIGAVRTAREDAYGIFQEAEIVPFVDLMALQEVLVITHW